MGCVISLSCSIQTAYPRSYFESLSTSGPTIHGAGLDASGDCGDGIDFAEGSGETSHAVDGDARDRRGSALEHLFSYCQGTLKVDGMAYEAGEL